MLDAHQKQRYEHGDKTEAIEKETPTFANPHDRETSDGGANNAGTIKDGRVKSNRVRQILFANHLNEEGLAYGDVEGIDDADQERDDDEMPLLDEVREGKHRQEKSEDHRAGLRDDDASVAIVAIADVATHPSQEKHGDLIGETEDAEHGYGTGEAIDKPLLSSGLHPGADQGNELTDNEKLKVAVLKGTKPVGQSGNRSLLNI